MDRQQRSTQRRLGGSSDDDLAPEVLLGLFRSTEPLIVPCPSLWTRMHCLSAKYCRICEGSFKYVVPTEERLMVGHMCGDETCSRTLGYRKVLIRDFTAALRRNRQEADDNRRVGGVQFRAGVYIATSYVTQQNLDVSREMQANEETLTYAANLYLGEPSHEGLQELAKYGPNFVCPNLKRMRDGDMTASMLSTARDFGDVRSGQMNARYFRRLYRHIEVAREQLKDFYLPKDPS